MGFLHISNGGGNQNSSVKFYTIPIDNTSFSAADSGFKTNVVHNLETNNLIVQVNNSGVVSPVKYKCISDNEVEVYYDSASDVTVTIIGFNKVDTGELSIVGLGVVGKMILGKR